MGRTLHYVIKPQNGCFTKKELEKLYDVGRIYREKCDWTCESIDIDPYSIYPNWDTNGDKGCGAGWDRLTKRQNEIAQTDKHPNDIAQQLVKEKIANLHHNDTHPKYGFGGCTKTGGNELNSLQVVMALLAASRVVKNALIMLHDEGELLKCPIVISKDKARPDRDRIDSRIAYLLSGALFDDVYSSHSEDFIERAKILYEFIAPKNDNQWHTIGGDWANIAKFVRPIDPKDFEDYPEYNAAQIMAGFEGEYFGLAKDDPEAASYRMIAMFQKALPDNLNIEICPKINH